MKYFLALVLFSQTAFANCVQDVTYLNPGDQVPCSGYLFVPAKELEVRAKIINYDKMQTLVNQQDELINVLNKRVDNAAEQNKNLSDQLALKDNESFMQKVIYFSLGVLVTGAIAYGTVKLLK